MSFFNRNLRRAAFLLCGTALLPWGAPEALAQQADSEPDLQTLEEIVVTARKREESLQRTPISITAFTGMSLDQQNITNVSQIAEATPNLIFDTGAPISGTSSAASVYIRGIGQIDFTLTTEPGVGIYLDGIYLSQSIGGVLDLVDVERIEVLRGPQGTLFGRNTIGGAINITSKLPDDEYSGNLSVTAGKFDRIDTRLNVNLPLSDTLFAKASAVTFNRNGFVDTPNRPGRLGDDDLQSGRLALRWTPSGTFEANFFADYTRGRENGAPAVLVGEFTGLPFPPAPLPPSFAQLHNILTAIGALPGAAFFGPADVVDIDGPLVNTSDIDLSSEADIWGLGLVMDWDIGFMNIKSISSFRSVEARTGRDQDGTPAIIGQQLDTFDVDQFSQELQFSGEAMAGRLNWILGLYHFIEDGVNIDDVEFTPVRIISGAKVDNRSSAVFGQFSYDLLNDLSLTAGFRFTDERKKVIIDDSIQFVLNSKFTSSNIPFPPGPPVLPLSDAQGNFVAPLFGLIGVGEPDPANPGFFGPTRVLPEGISTQDISEFTPYVSLAYQWTADIMTYVSYSEGFKSGGFTQRVFPPKTGIPVFAPEFAQVFEAGFKLSALDNRLRFNGAAFHTDYDDLQIQVNDGIAPVTRNAAAAEIDGFELELTALPAPGWMISGGVGFMDADYTALDPSVALATDIRTITLDSKLPNAPKWQLNGAISYTHSLASGAALATRFDVSYRSLTFNDALNFPEIAQPGYALVNGSITYVAPGDNWEVTFFVRNLTDKRYLVSGFANALTQGTADGIVGRPREWAVRVGYSF
ncbi:MAG: TonB-dependent receptor [Sphingomonadales bacterium]